MQSFAHLNTLFDSQYAEERLHHAWIIEGAEEGKVINWLEEVTARLIGGPLGEGYFHPNVMWMNREDSHNVESVRSVIHFLEKTSWDGHWKVAVIFGVEQLNPQGQNALLKMVEEPPARSIIFLISQKVRTLLPTLYSRGLHIVLSDDQHKEHSDLDIFVEDWVKAATEIILRQNYEKLFDLQVRLTEENIDPETQAKWTFYAVKQIINMGQIDATSINAKFQHLVQHISHEDWLSRWERGQKYYADAMYFNVDLKQLCVKLTVKILGDRL
ncbi:MAG: hypothetical protein H6492_03190 [Candidatus Paracaedibacteraceae bacterium]|nr:hypothetical protein [Candidatus Paracaedibacteraceae bacterium]